METMTFAGKLLNLFFLASPEVKKGKSENRGGLNVVTGAVLRLMAFQFNHRPSLKKYMRSADGWINFKVGFKTELESVSQVIVFHNGRVRVDGTIPADVDVILRFRDEKVLMEMASSTPNEMLNLILKNRLIPDGNLAVAQLFNFYISLILGGIHQIKLNWSVRKEIQRTRKENGLKSTGLSRDLLNRRNYRMKATPGADGAVKYLVDPYLSEFSIETFPRLQKFLDIHFNTLPEVCAERPLILTRWFRENGFEEDNDGNPWVPELRQAKAFRHLMAKREPIIRENDLIAGTTSSKEVGALVFPDGHGTMFWGELNSAEERFLNPCVCTKETAEIFHNEVFPFWMNRNFREYVRSHYNHPLCQKIDERFVAYFVWKNVGISHTIPNFPRLLEQGTSGISERIKERILAGDLDSKQRAALDAMEMTLEGVNIYAGNLAANASLLAKQEKNEKRKEELERLAAICVKVPLQPADTLDEAVNSIWIIWAAIHNENSNTGTSLGRLDQLLQPFFERDMEKLKTAREREAYIRHATELVGCLFMRLTDHVPLLPDIANYLFGGASSTQAITIGGVTPEGEDAVNDMTYIFLKVTEILGIRDANINARYHCDKNSDTYLKRLCEVNVITSATPIMQSDTAMMKALKQHGYSEEIINDWAATGCVEPTIQGRNFSHTGSILLNMVASMEMTLDNGNHPVMGWRAGPETGSIENGDFKNFEDFFTAWAVQQNFLIDQAVELNNMMGEAHQQIRPTPFLSTLIDGTIQSAKDVVQGGAEFNSSGTSNIGLADVIDSLLVIKQLVFDEKKVSFCRLKKAVDTNFKEDPALFAMVQKKVRLFGSGDETAVSMGNRVIKVVHDCYMAHTNYRGGRYSAGFWSMSQHVAYGSLSGTLPSGRLAGKPFTPGLTPSPLASNNFLDNISSVAKLNPEHMDNNIAFNVKLNPSAEESREKTVDNIFACVKSYFIQGGMQMQFNVVTSKMLREAMAHPDEYKTLMVRISGYNAYFVDLNREIQKELVERTEFKI